MRPKRFSYSPATADADGVCASQTPAAGGEQSLTINGALASGGVATFDIPRHVSITAAANDSARTFTVTGTDKHGKTILETIAGPNTTTTTGVLNFKTITSVTVDDDTAGAITVGSADEFDTYPLVIGGREHPQTSYSVNITGSVTFDVKYTLDDVFASDFDPSAAHWISHSTSKSADFADSIDFPVTAVRAEFTSVVSGVTAEINFVPTRN